MYTIRKVYKTKNKKSDSKMKQRKVTPHVTGETKTQKHRQIKHYHIPSKKKSVKHVQNIITVNNKQ